ncbi:major facilitator superfamily domain-containing protein 6-like [Gambusia affinis]|uniref:major facilitator superfamily domain-containing protein 6-like n=1 Tax=Gambusia affinis TaxID=33528 RepID=UPI001CDBBB6F|nr:major facilitator superfamily domain-containing protein 6-like [Gambusia affinis]XP_043956447.1 major facilitator superfamily domain-containing protein 6-like [Gambusia affinis]XP_043956448.1 major facilitator superfamily domain-containing protein 6-like [Gambusia affinis]
MRRTTQIDVKRALVLTATFSFLCCCSKACLLPFLTLYFRQLGLSPSMTGIVMATKHSVTLVWSPAAGLLSKRYNKRRVVINCSLVFSAAAVLLLLLLPSAGTPGAQSSTCNTSNLSSGSGQSQLNVTPSTRSQMLPTHTNLVIATSPNNSINEWKLGPVTTPPNRNHTEHSEVPVSQGNSSDVPIISQTVASVEHSTVSSLVTSARNKRSVITSDRFEDEQKGSSGFLASLKEMDIQNQLFYLTLIIVLVWEFASAPLEWTANDGLYEYLDYADASDRHGSADVWGLLGAVCGVGGAGLVVAQLSCHVAATHASRSAVHFYSYAGLAALALPVGVYLPLYLNRKRDRANGLLKGVQLVHGSPHALLCAFTIVLVGVVNSAVENFLLWQMEDHGSTELHMGLSLALSLLSQAVFPLLAGRVSKLLSPGRVLVVGTASLGLQCFYYSFLWGPWAAFPAQVLSTFSSGAVWWAVRIQSEDVATPGAERSVRRVYGCLCLHLGSGLGSFASGFVAQRFGVTWLFRGVAIGIMAWCACLPLLQWKAPLQRRINYSRLLAADASEASDSESEPERDWLDKAMEDDRGNNNYERRIGH